MLVLAFASLKRYFEVISDGPGCFQNISICGSERGLISLFSNKCTFQRNDKTEGRIANFVSCNFRTELELDVIEIRKISQTPHVQCV